MNSLMDGPAASPISRNVRLMMWFEGCIGLLFYGPVMIIYFESITGSYALGMSVISITMLAAALLEVPTGVLGDLVGLSIMVRLGALSNLLAVVGYAIGGSYWVLLAGGVLEGAARALWSGNNHALLYESLAESGEEARFGEYNGKISSAHQGALATGSLLGGAVAMVSLPVAFWLSIVPVVAALVLSLGLREPRTTHPRSGNPVAHLRASLEVFRMNYRLRLLTSASVSRFALGEASFQLRPVFTSTLWPLWGVGIAKALDHALGSISFYISGPTLRRFPALAVLVGGNLVDRVSSVLAFALPGALSPALLSANSLTYGASQVATNVLAQREFTSAQRATLGSISSLANGIVFAFVSTGLGALADRFGSTQTLLLAQIGLAIPLLLYWRIFRHERRTGLSDA
jgi:MFS family permease